MGRFLTLQEFHSIFHSMNIEELIQLPEGKTLEFKENAEPRAKILSTIIAFANTSGGRLIIGVEDKTRRLVGVEEPQKLAEALANMIHDSVAPKLFPNIEVLSIRNKNLLLIEIYPSALRPHCERTKGKDFSTYIRIGPTTRLADADLQKAIERSVLVKSFDENPCYEASYEELCQESIAQFFAQHRKIMTNDLLTLGVLVQEKNKLVPTVGGVLLFSKNRLAYFPDAWIQMGAFLGNDKSEILDSQEITTFLPEAVDSALAFLRKNMRVRLRIEDVRHEEVWEIPKIALREALINALIHSDYALRGAPIRVALFQDRVEIENSGLLLWGLTIENLKTGVSKLRNPVIARVFKELGLIEQWGSGIQRMIKVCENAGIEPPVFEEIGPRIRVTFFKKRITPPALSAPEEQILDFLQQKGALSTNDLAQLIGMSRRTVIQKVKELKHKGRIYEVSTSPTDPKKQYKAF